MRLIAKEIPLRSWSQKVGSMKPYFEPDGTLVVKMDTDESKHQFVVSFLPHEVKQLKRAIANPKEHTNR